MFGKLLSFLSGETYVERMDREAVERKQAAIEADNRRWAEEATDRRQRNWRMLEQGQERPASSRSTWDDSPLNPATPLGMVISPLSPLSGGFDISPSCDGGSSGSGSDSGSSCGGGGGD